MRKRTEIDPVRADRLNFMIEREGYSKKQFAKLLEMSPENLSRIVNERHPLTEETARTIIEKFPGYCLEWLLGYDNCMTVNEKLMSAIDQTQSEGEVLENALFGLARLSGFTIKPTEAQPDRSVRSIINTIKTGVTFQRDGKSVSFSLAELNDFENELCDYVEMRLKRMLK